MGNSTEKSSTIDSQQNIIGFKNNDPKTLKKVYMDMYPKARAYILKNKGNDALAKDIFQEAFIACWRNIKEGKLLDHVNLEGYLFTIVKNKWRDQLRSNRFRKTISMNGLSLVDTIKDVKEKNHGLMDKRHQAIKEAVAQLGAACQKLLREFYFDRKSMTELATMGLEEASIRNKKYRCMQKLRESIKKNQYNEES